MAVWDVIHNRPVLNKDREKLIEKVAEVLAGFPQVLSGLIFLVRFCEGKILTTWTLAWSHSRLFDGYKSHTAMDKESEFITAV